MAAGGRPMMVLTLGFVVGADAQTVNFDLDADRAGELGIDTGAVESDLGSKIAASLGIEDPDAYLKAFANADAMAMKGMGVDYATNPKKFSIGGALGSAVSGVPLSFVREHDELPEGGFAFMASM